MEASEVVPVEMPPGAILAPSVSGKAIMVVPTAAGLELRIEGIDALVYSNAEEASQLMRAVQVGWELTQLKRGMP